MKKRAELFETFVNSLKNEFVRRFENNEEYENIIETTLLVTKYENKLHLNPILTNKDLTKDIIERTIREKIKDIELIGILICKIVGKKVGNEVGLYFKYEEEGFSKSLLYDYENDSLEEHEKLIDDIWR